MEKLNNPYYIYPGFPFSGYLEYSKYNDELIKLYNYINELKDKINGNTILHISFGSAAEDHYNNMNERYNNNIQWQQLFPEHIQRAIREMPDYKIINIIITPSKQFKEDYVPVFIEKTPELEWFKDNNYSYLSRTNNNISVKIFNCPMPSEYDYTKVIDKLRLNSDTFIQTKYDKTFIKNFYSDLDKLFLKIYQFNGLVTCFSYVVFNEDTQKRIYNNYYLFREIKKLFEENYTASKRLLAEWVYRLDHYNVVIHNTSKRDNLILYVKPQTLDNDDVDDFEYYELNLYNFRTSLVLYKNSQKNKNNSLFESLNINDSAKIKNIKSKILEKLIEHENKGNFKTYDKSVNIDKLEITFNNIVDKERKLFLSYALSVDVNGRVFNTLELDFISTIIKKRIIVFNKNGKLKYDTNENENDFQDNPYKEVFILEYDDDNMTYQLIRHYVNNEFYLFL